MTDRDDALAALSEEIDRLLRAGAEIDETALAARFGVEPADVAACAAALRHFGDALDEDLPPDLPAPELPDDYELVGEIGRGGMGVVYRARQRSLDRPVAVKVLRPGELMFAEAIRRFEKEARSLAKLRHPHIVSVHEVGRAGGHVFFSMDLIEGGSLADRIRAGTMTTSEAVRLLAQVADAIAYTHSRGIVHRDLKPENILIDAGGDAYVVDFGLARDIAVRSDLTVSGRILGTPAYMSPEQARGDADRIGEATDVYALGAILYECLTGRTPFSGLPLVEQIHAVIHQEPVRPAKRNPRVPKDLEAICLKSLAKEPGRRYPTARALREDLLAFAEGRAVRARPPSRLVPAIRFAARHRAAIGTAAVAVAVLVAAFFVFVLPRIGRTPTGQIATAEDLEKGGEPGAAAILYEEVLGSADARLPEDVRNRADRGLARARMGKARELARAGETREALDLIDRALADGDRTFGRDGWPEKSDLLWDRVLVLRELDDDARAEKALSDLSNRLRDEAHALDRSRGHLGRTDPFAYADRELLRRLTALVDDGDVETAGWACLMISGPGSRGGPTAWALENGERVVPVLVRAVRDLGSDREEERIRSLADGVEFCVRGLLGSDLVEPLSKGLAALARDETAADGARGMALKLLARLNDLPRTEIRQAGRTPPLPAFRRDFLEETLALWQDVRYLPPVEAFRRRVAAAVEATERPWLRNHTGRTDIDEAWWRENGDRDPRQWLGERYGLAPDASPTDIFRVFERADPDDRFPLHTLLALSSPPTLEPPLWPYGLPEPPGLTAAWRRAVSAPADARPYLVRIARFDASDGRPDPEIVWEETIPVRIGECVPIEKVWSEARRWSRLLTVPGLGGSARDGPVRFGVVSTGVALDWEGEDLRASWGALRPAASGPDRGQPASILAWPTSVQNEFDGSHGRTVDEFEVAVVEDPGADPRPWTLADWRRRLLENLEYLASEAEKPEPADDSLVDSFHRRFYRSVWMLGPIAAHLGPLPEAAGTIHRLVAAIGRRGGEDAGNWLPALLVAGEPEALADPQSLTAALENANLDKGIWVRVLLGTDRPEIREHALGVIEGWSEIPLGLQARLAEAIDAGRLDAPAGLRERVSGGAVRYEIARMDDAFPVLILGAIAALAGLVALPFALRGGRRAAAVLVAAGLVFAAIDVSHRGTDLLPDGVGFALAAVGSLVLARRAGRKAARAAPVAFVLAAVAEAAATVGIPPMLTLGLAELFAGAGVFALPWLVSPRIVRPVFWLLYGAPVALVWLVTAWVLVSGTLVDVWSGWVIWAVVAAAAGAIWAAGSVLVRSLRAPEAASG